MFGGMMVATVMSLVFVPMLYFVIQTISEKLGAVGVVAETADQTSTQQADD